jgi:hypothetical protein
MSENPSDRIAMLESQIRKMKVIGVLSAIVLAMALYVATLSFRAEAQSSDRVLRVRGIVIEDAAGHERILIGAPIPPAQNRVRTDEARVRQLWATRYPSADRYMNFYKDYQHATNGILILDEKGFDRIALGDPVPDPNIGKRIGPSTGMVINDEQGNERSGYGLLKVNDRYRVVFGMDSSQGREALSLVTLDGGPTRMSIDDAQRHIYVGSASASEKITGAEEPFYGVVVKGPDGTRSLTASGK